MIKKITHEQARESIEMVDSSFFPIEKEALLTYINQQELKELFEALEKLQLENKKLLETVNHYYKMLERER